MPTELELPDCSIRVRPDDRLWYAIRVQPNYESIVSTTLRGKGYEKFLPLYRSERRWSDRVKKLDLPLFPGYLFCRLDVRERLLPVLATLDPPVPEWFLLTVHSRCERKVANALASQGL